METKELKEKLMYYYEIDLENCKMTNIDWIEEIVKCLTDENYLKDFEEEYEHYCKERGVEL